MVLLAAQCPAWAGLCYQFIYSG